MKKLRHFCPQFGSTSNVSVCTGNSQVTAGSWFSPQLMSKIAPEKTKCTLRMNSFAKKIARIFVYSKQHQMRMTPRVIVEQKTTAKELYQSLPFDLQAPLPGKSTFLVRATCRYNRR
jgi:hypothetical protein